LKAEVRPFPKTAIVMGEGEGTKKDIGFVRLEGVDNKVPIKKGGVYSYTLPLF
jgi:hypothetical protein